MSQHSKKRTAPVILSTSGATVLKNSEKRIATTKEVDSERCDLDEILAVSAIPLNWTVAAYKAQFPEC